VGEKLGYTREGRSEMVAKTLRLLHESGKLYQDTYLPKQNSFRVRRFLKRHPEYDFASVVAA